MWFKNKFIEEANDIRAKLDAREKDLVRRELHIQKTFSIFTGSDQSSILSILAQQRKGGFWALISTYINLYSRIEPLSNGIDLIANSLSQINLKLWDKKNKQYIDTHPILELLDNPNPLPNTNYCNFIGEMSKFYSITGNAFIINTLSTSKQPLEMYVISPQYINWMVGGDGYIDSYNYTPQAGSITFNRQPDFRYISQDGTKQLLHIKDFNPFAFDMYLYGLSRLHSILYELFQYQSASVHNLSLLNNGARMGAVIGLKDPDSYTKEDESYLQAQLENMYSGSSNAGRTLMSSLIDSVSNIGQTNVDMDFGTMKTKVTEAIYNRFQIPLALINSTSLSLANMETAQENLYDHAVLPQLNTLLEFLTNNLMSYYKNSENLILTYDPFTIDAIRKRNIEEAVQLKTLNVLTDNELRNRIDSAPYSNGDEIYKPSTEIPVEADIENGD